MRSAAGCVLAALLAGCAFPSEEAVLAADVQYTYLIGDVAFSVPFIVHAETTDGALLFKVEHPENVSLFARGTLPPQDGPAVANGFLLAPGGPVTPILRYLSTDAEDGGRHATVAGMTIELERERWGGEFHNDGGPIALRYTDDAEAYVVILWRGQTPGTPLLEGYWREGTTVTRISATDVLVARTLSGSGALLGAGTADTGVHLGGAIVIGGDEESSFGMVTRLNGLLRGSVEDREGRRAFELPWLFGSHGAVVATTVGKSTFHLDVQAGQTEGALFVGASWPTGSVERGLWTSEMSS